MPRRPVFCLARVKCAATCRDIQLIKGHLSQGTKHQNQQFAQWTRFILCRLMLPCREQWDEHSLMASPKYWPCGLRKRNPLSSPLFPGALCEFTARVWLHAPVSVWEEVQFNSICISLPFSNETASIWAGPLIMQSRWAEFRLIRLWAACSRQ